MVFLLRLWIGSKENKGEKERREEMGWVWKDDEDDSQANSRADGKIYRASIPNSGDGCSTRKIMKSNCRTEEVELGKFIRKCEKTEEILRSCVGKPVEVVKSSSEYTEDDVTNEMARGSVRLESSPDPFDFPGLRSDMESIERSVLGGLGRFFEGAEEMRNGFFQAFGAPRIFDRESSPSTRREIPVEGQFEGDASREQKSDESDYSGFSGKVIDV